MCSDRPGSHEQLGVEEACDRDLFHSDVVFRRVEAGIGHVPDTAMNDDVLLPPRQPGIWGQGVSDLGVGVRSVQDGTQNHPDQCDLRRATPRVSLVVCHSDGHVRDHYCEFAGFCEHHNSGSQHPQC